MTRAFRYVVILLPCVVTVLLCATLRLHAETRGPTASALRRWEYIRIFRQRQAIPATDWTVTQVGSQQVSIADLDPLLAQLGAQGWELVSVYSMATDTGMQSSGTTTAQGWVFKRPAP
jgi:hypothetical protein